MNILLVCGTETTKTDVNQKNAMFKIIRPFVSSGVQNHIGANNYIRITIIQIIAIVSERSQGTLTMVSDFENEVMEGV